MKLYVLPVERYCNGSCKFCITNVREKSEEEYLKKEALEAVLHHGVFESIEITGGGEPSLHKQIDDIITICSKHARTQLYTNGSLLRSLSNLELLECLCLSVAHHDAEKNKQIMGITADLNYAKLLNVPKKFSLLLHKSGISTPEAVFAYLDFAKAYAKKVVVRQMFEQEYPEGLKSEFVLSQEVFDGLHIRTYNLNGQGNPFFSYEGMEVEFELRSCACEVHNPVLHADGLLYKGWSRELL
jgi:organic radical activating enzyme